MPLDPITTIISVPAIVAIVNLIKKVTPRLSTWAALVSVLVAVAISMSAWAWGNESWFHALVAAILVGLSAAGLYDLAPGAPDTRSDLEKIISHADSQ